MTDKSGFLKQYYTFSDFIFYMAMLAVPMVTAVVAIADKSLAGTLVFLLVLAGSIPVILRVFCTHCPHYCRTDKKLKCIFFWGLPKFFAQRPGPLSFWEKVLSVTGPALVLLYPVYWLAQAPGLFIVYLLSVTVFGASIRRNECPRCIYTECPVNIASRR